MNALKIRFPRLPLIFLTLAATVFVTAAAYAAVDNSRFHEANAAYSRNDFKSAIAIYEELLQQHGYAPGILYNLANSYARDGRIGKAVLNYERAAKLDPGDPDITGNLQLVRTASGLFTEEENLAERLPNLLSLNQWIGLGSLALVALTCTLLLSLWLKLSPRLLTALTILCLAVMTTAVIAAAALAEEWSEYVVVSATRLQISPFDGAAALGNIQEGRMVETGQQHSGYIFVEDETGRKGWIPSAAIEPVIPPRLQ